MVVDQKEGLYFAAERPDDARPLHGANLFPSEDDAPGLRDAVLDYMAALKGLSHTVLMAIVVGGKFGPRLYYKWRHGIDIGPWIKSLRTGKRVSGKPLAKPGSRKKLLDEVAVLAQMEVDDAADRSREIARLRAERQQR